MSCPVACSAATDEGRSQRERWGCDAPGTKTYSVTCGRCHGRVELMEDCKRCKGTGYRTMDRCPTSLLTPTLQHRLELLSASEELQALPAAGGLDDQPEWFLRLYGETRAEAQRARAEEDAKEARWRAAKRKYGL